MLYFVMKTHLFGFGLLSMKQMPSPEGYRRLTIDLFILNHADVQKSRNNLISCFPSLDLSLEEMNIGSWNKDKTLLMKWISIEFYIVVDVAIICK